MANVIRANSDAYESGEAYLARLQDEVNKNFQIMLALLSSYWKSTVDGPNYARSLKAVSIAISQIRIALDDLYADNAFRQTRGEFVTQVVSSLAFPKRAPDVGGSEDDLRSFLIQVIELYFKGSVPESVKKGVELITGGEVRIYEAFAEARKPGSGYDISDEFRFAIDVILEAPTDTFVADRNVRVLMQILRPAHTLYRLRYVLADQYVGQQMDPAVGQPGSQHKVLDSYRMAYSDYRYEDFRRYSLGVSGVDPLGAKRTYVVTAEDHSGDF